jgi:Icc-related predicted phosphoesterase
MKILHISDTHSHHRELRDLPGADVIIHSGDMCFAGTADEFSDFVNWLCGLDYKYKLFIAGNHDCILHDADADKLQSLLPENVAYLCHSGVEIDGVRLWGVPFMLEMQSDYRTKLAEIPSDIDVLITHNPPYGILDFSDNINYGCTDVLQIVLKIKPHYHLFGHVHAAYGIEKSIHTTYRNAALMNEDYELVNKAVLLEI